MAKQYYVKRDPSATGNDIEWNALTGQAFYHLITSMAGKGRYFIDMDDFLIEASQEEYIKWRQEKNHSDYLRSWELEHPQLSLYSDAIGECGNGEEAIPDEEIDVEELVLHTMECNALRAALEQLDTADYCLIHAMYLVENQKTERSLAHENGVSQNAIHKQKKRILKKIKSEVVKSKKSQQ